MAKSKVIALEDNFDAVRKAITGDMLMEAAMAGGSVIEGHAKVNAGSGRPGLRIGDGNLTGSIHTEEAGQTRHRATANTGTNVIYARIHEFGGIITPVSAKSLSWINESGERVFAGSVHIPARPYLRPAIDENERDIVKAVETELWRNLDRVTK